MTGNTFTLNVCVQNVNGVLALSYYPNGQARLHEYADFRGLDDWTDDIRTDDGPANIDKAMARFKDKHARDDAADWRPEDFSHLGHKMSQQVGTIEFRPDGSVEEIEVYEDPVRRES